MVLVADLSSGLLAFVFGSAAIGKLLRQRQQVQTAEKLRIPWGRYRWIAAPEAAASIALLTGYASAPFAAAAAIGLVLLMAGALVFRLRIHDSFGFLLGDAVLLGLAAATATLSLVATSVCHAAAELDALSVPARRLAAALREGARERELRFVADAMGDAAHRLLALAEEPRGELHAPAGQVRGGRLARHAARSARRAGSSRRTYRATSGARARTAPRSAARPRLQIRSGGG
jgi:hypothetical protein